MSRMKLSFKTQSLQSPNREASRCRIAPYTEANPRRQYSLQPFDWGFDRASTFPLRGPAWGDPSPGIAEYSLGVRQQLACSIVAVFQQVGKKGWHQDIGVVIKTCSVLQYQTVFEQRESKLQFTSSGAASSEQAWPENSVLKHVALSLKPKFQTDVTEYQRYSRRERHDSSLSSIEVLSKLACSGWVVGASIRMDASHSGRGLRRGSIRRAT
jgi:hypothetical protein